MAQLTFAGLKWDIKTFSYGTHIFDAANAFVDAMEWLHLKVSQVGSVWHSGGIRTCDSTGHELSFGFGTFELDIESPMNNVKPDVGFGFYLHPWASPANEIDFFEVGKWATGAKHIKFTVFPDGSTSGEAQKIMGFDYAGPTHLKAVRASGSVYFELSRLDTGEILAAWTCTSSQVKIPQNAMAVNIGFSLLSASTTTAPVDGEQEMVISDFRFTPEGETPPPPPPTPTAQIVVSSLTAEPNPAYVGEQVTFSVTATNNGNASGSATIILGGAWAGIQVVSLVAGESKLLQFIGTAGSAGNYTVTCGSLSILLVVKTPATPPPPMPGPAVFAYSNLTISPSSVHRRHTATVSVKVTNTGGVTGTTTVQLTGWWELSKTITLGAGTSTVVTFSFRIGGLVPYGGHPVIVGPLTGTLIVVR